MIKFNKAELKDKIHACWIGKNIGGSIGTPYEDGCFPVMNDCTGFQCEPGNPFPNDDLDLQLIWLLAMAQNGPDAVNSQLLGEYWLEYVTPYWSEYGISKTNMEKGMLPPLAGQYKNNWKHSNGAWIRTEIWASLFPGDVDAAIRYAYEDSRVDHGHGEGTYASIFVAAMEAAAFVINDLRTLINIGLSKIPQSSKMYLYLTKVVECYDKGMDWKDVRNLITDMALEDKELSWFQAPANVGYALIGLLYGEGDFKKSVLIACNCGDDTDCTSATVGALLGIMHGTEYIPADWKEYIGDRIITAAINMGHIWGEPREFMSSCTALTNKVMQIQQMTLARKDIFISETELTDTSDIKAEDYMGNDFAMSLSGRSTYFTDHKSLLADCIMEYSKEPEIAPNESMTFKLSIKSPLRTQKIFIVDWYLPEGWKVEGRKCINAMNFTSYFTEEYVLTAGEKVSDRNKILVTISCDGHFQVMTIPIILLG